MLGLLHLLLNADLFIPEHIGSASVMVCAGKVVQIKQAPDVFSESVIQELNVEVVDLGGRMLVPGFIDGHVHITGGGGEAGYNSAAPPMVLSDMTTAGVTTVVGLLGTDDCTRSTASLLVKAKGLEKEGITALTYSGGYHIPPTTLLGTVKQDIVYTDNCVACGEIALSDHRSSQPQYEELLRLASDCHVAGLMTGKAGTLHLHLGDGNRGLQLVRRALDESEIPARVFNPTHVNRRQALLEEALELAARGCTVDVTAYKGWVPASDSIRRYMRDPRGLPKSGITCSSDAGGCFPAFDENKNVVGMTFGRCDGLLATLNELVTESAEGAGDALSLQEALLPFTANWAALLRLGGKGRIAVGADADLVVLAGKAGNLEISDVMARGRWMVRDHVPVVKGTFE